MPPLWKLFRANTYGVINGCLVPKQMEVLGILGISSPPNKGVFLEVFLVRSPQRWLKGSEVTRRQGKRKRDCAASSMQDTTQPREPSRSLQVSVSVVLRAHYANISVT